MTLASLFYIFITGIFNNRIDTVKGNHHSVIYSLVDSIFLLHSLVNKMNNEKGRLYYEFRYVKSASSKVTINRSKLYTLGFNIRVIKIVFVCLIMCRKLS